jgi:hypothetical protein
MCFILLWSNTKKIRETYTKIYMTEKRRIQMPMEFYDILVKRLESKKAELKERQE